MKTSYRTRFLNYLARATVKKYEPGIIAITGALGKTAAKEALYTILRDVRTVRASSHYFPNEISASLAIIGPSLRGRGFSFWLNTLWTGWINLITTKSYPELLILEYPPYPPKTIQGLLRIAPPQISVVTTIGEGEHLAHEAARCIEALPSNGYGVLNYDDSAVFGMKEYTRAHIITFGFNEGADMRIVGFEHRAEELPGLGYKPIGISFKLAFGATMVPIRLDGAFGVSHAYAIAAAACVGTAFGCSLVRIAEAIQYHQTAPHRLQIIPGKKGTYIIDDTYDTNPASLREALHTAGALPSQRTLCVIDALPIAESEAPEIYDTLRKLALKTCDMIVVVGAENPLFDRSASRKNMVYCDTPEEAAGELQVLIERGDLILIKGRSLRALVNELSSHRLVA